MPSGAENETVATVGPWPRGLNNWVDPAHIRPDEVADIVDMDVSAAGELSVRDRSD